MSKKQNIILGVIILVLMVFVAVMWHFLNRSLTEQKLHNLEFDILIQENGNVQITEYWDISFRNTKTLYKNFEIAQNTYSNVSVKEINDNRMDEYDKINTYQYHLKNHTFYALDLQNGWFEIAWGTDFAKTKVRKKYQISYTIENAVTRYEDCAEFYWQLLGEGFDIYANQIKGTITLPNGIENKDDIKAWGHLESLNGKIKVQDVKTISFNVKYYQENQPLEVRIMLPPEVIQTRANRVNNREAKEKILLEEKTYAKDSNEVRIRNYLIGAVIMSLLFAIVCFEIKTIMTYIKIAKVNKNKKLKPEIDYEYFRELPSENTSPGEAIFLINSKHEPTHGNFSDIFVATMLSLVHKKYFEIQATQCKNNKQGNDLKLTEKSKKYKQEWKYHIEKAEDLLEDEIQVLEYLLKMMENKEKIGIGEIARQIKEKQGLEPAFLELIESVQNKIEVAQNLKGNINFESKRMVKQYQEKRAFNVGIISFIFIIMRLLSGLIDSLWVLGMTSLMIIPVINIFVLGKVKKTIPYLSQKGIDESDKWEALKKYLEEYSLLNEKTETSLEIWEEFLIYATAFGISEKVLEQLDLRFKDKWSNSSYYKFSHFSELIKFQDTLNETIIQSLNTIHSGTGFSSGAGFGGGFSSGGGRRWWKKPVEAEDKK